MNKLEEMLKANEAFCKCPPVDYQQEDLKQSKLPQRQIALVTCMDTRLVNFLEPALGISRGEVKIIKTAGNCVTGAFDGVVRSLLVCVYELGVEEVFIVGHHECGMAHTTSEGLKEKMISRGVRPEAIHMVERELREWADEFHHPEDNVRRTVEALRLNPLFPEDVKFHGLMFHPRSGKIDVVCRA